MRGVARTGQSDEIKRKHHMPHALQPVRPCRAVRRHRGDSGRRRAACILLSRVHGRLAL